MSAFARFWSRMSQSARLMAALVTAVVLALCIVCMLILRLTSQEARSQIDSRLQENMAFLAHSVAAELQSRHGERVETVLKQQLALPDVRSIEFRSATDTVAVENPISVVRTAPDWFVRLCSPVDRHAMSPVTVGRREIGQVSLTLSPMPIIDDAWSFLWRQMQVLAFGAFVMFCGIWLVLRSNLKPLQVLLAGSRALSAGDFSQRLQPQGSTEFRATIEAFNRMAADVERLIHDERLREENLRVTLHSIGDAVLVTDTAGRVTLMNPVSEALTGWNEAEARGRPVGEVFHIINEETRAIVESPIDIVLREGKVVGLANHTVLIARDGTERPIADSGAPIRYSADGEISGVVLVFRDQSEEHRMQKALRASERLYASLVNSVPVGICRTDAEGTVIFANDMMLKMAGMDGKDMSLERWAAARHPDDREPIDQIWRGARATRRAVQGVYRYLHTDGSISWVKANNIPMRDDDEEFDGYISVVVDITAEREQLGRIERLSRLYATLSQINSAIIQCEDERQLYEAICTIMVEKGGFGSSRICVADWARRKSIIVVTRGAWTSGVLSQDSEMDLDDPEFQTLTTMALRSGARVTANDIQCDERLNPAIRVRLKKAGLQSSSTIVLSRFGEAIAVLGLSSAEKDFFSDDILALIDQVGRDASFALENFAREEERRCAQDKLAHSEENLRVTLHSIGDAVLVTDASGAVTMMNPVAETLTGWSEAEARGRMVGEVFHIVNEDTRVFVESPIEVILRDGKVVVGLANHTVLIARDGTERPIADSGAPIRYSADGEISGVVLVFRDQSEEHRMQKALRASERLYASLVNSVPVGICRTDAEGTVIFASDMMLKMAGMDGKDMSLERWAAARHPDDRESITRAWRKARAARCHVQEHYRYLHADGSISWVKASGIPVIGDNGEFDGYIDMIVDITAEREQLRAIERLSRFNAILSQVNAAIVHCANERELYDEVIRVFVDSANFEMVTFYETNPENERGVDVQSYSPTGLEPSKAVSEFLNQEQLPPLTVIVFASGEPLTSNDYLNDPRVGHPWHDMGVTAGIAACSFIPIKCLEATVAVMALGAHECGFFTGDVLALLEEIGSALSHALAHIAGERRRRQAETALADNEERQRLTLSVTNTGTYELDITTGRVAFDAICMRLMGLGEEGQTDEAGEFINQRFSGDMMRRSLKLRNDLMQGKRTSYSVEIPYTAADGTTRWLRNHGAATPERTAEGLPRRVLGVISDITAIKSLEERDRLAVAVFDNSGEGILITDSSFKVVMVNQAFCRDTGYELDEAAKLDANLFRTDRQDGTFYNVVMRDLRKNGTWQGELWLRRKNGDIFPALVGMTTVKNASGHVTHYVLQETDISAQKEFEHRISHLAYRDALTDLPNRTLLRDRVEQGIAVAYRESSTLALLFLDLDHFKNINDSLGHAVGDRLLKEVARRLSESVREMDTVGRLGGDEFLVLLPDSDADAAAHVAQKLLEECARPFIFESHTLGVTPSVGIALYPKDGTNFDELLKTADTAMYRAKDEGRNAYRFYTPEMNQAVFQRMVLESSLRRAIEQNEFVLHYQPKFDLQHRVLVGAESLIRWHQPEMGMISPAQFIPVAEESGLIEAIGKWVLEETCRQIRVWRDEGLSAPRVAVNFSARQFAARNIVELIRTTLETMDLPGDRLEMEITESLLAQDMDYTFEVLQSLKNMGVHVAVDDFGTGYSSLSYLKRFPIDRLKIDQSFVRDLVSDADDRAIAAAVVTMGHSLGMRVIAEGVETAEQMTILRDMGCDEAQGYYLGRPIPGDEMSVALRKLAKKT